MPLRLLLVHAHPDDETLNNGATMAAAVAGGHAVSLVTCTRGEEGEVIGAEHAHRTSDRDDTLGEHRAVELAAAMRVLGVADHRFLDELPADPAASKRAWLIYRDTGMQIRPGGRAAIPNDVRPDCFAVADLDEAVSRLARHIRTSRPHVVITYEPGGGYGHPDHVMAHQVSLRAVELAGQGSPGTAAHPWDVPLVYGTVADVDELRSWLRARPGTGEWDPDGPLPHMFVPSDRIDAVVHAEGHLRAKADALRELPTQVSVLDDRPGSAALALSNDVPQPLSGIECYALLRPVMPGREPLPALAPDDPLRPLLDLSGHG